MFSLLILAIIIINGALLTGDYNLVQCSEIHNNNLYHHHHHHQNQQSGQTIVDSILTAAGTDSGTSDTKNNAATTSLSSSTTTSSSSSGVSVVAAATVTVIEQPNDGSISELHKSLAFDPSSIDFGAWSIGTARSHIVTLINKNTNRSVYLSSISGKTPMFYSSFFEDKVIPPQGNTTFNVVFLPRSHGKIESNLFIHTSFGQAKLPVKGEGRECPYRLRSLIGIKIPLNSTIRPEISMYNPHSRPIQILEIYSSEGQFQLELPSGDEEGPQNLWEIPPYTTKTIIRVRFHGTQPGNHSAYIRIKMFNNNSGSISKSKTSIQKDIVKLKNTLSNIYDDDGDEEEENEKDKIHNDSSYNNKNSATGGNTMKLTNDGRNHVYHHHHHHHHYHHNHDHYQDNDDNVLVIPIDVEILASHGIYTPNPIIDFGKITNDDDIKIIKIDLINSASDGSNSDNGRSFSIIDYELRNVNTNLIKYIPETDTLILNSKYAEDDQTIINGELIIRSQSKRQQQNRNIQDQQNHLKHQQQSSIQNHRHLMELSVDIHAEIYKGSLEYQKNLTVFITGAKNYTKYEERNFYIKNLYKIPIAITNYTIENNDSSIFKINFNGGKINKEKHLNNISNNCLPQILLPNNKLLLFKISAVNETANFQTQLIINTNLTKIQFPIIVCTGLLKRYTSIDPNNLTKLPDESILDFGIVPFGDFSNFGFILMTNPNPIPIQLIKWNFTNPHGVYYQSMFMGCAKKTDFISSSSSSSPSSLTSSLSSNNNEDDRKLNKQQQHEEQKLTLPEKFNLCLNISSSEIAAFELAVQSFNIKSFTGTFKVWTEIEEVVTTVKFVTVMGRLEIDQSRLHFSDCFPGKRCSADISIQSTFLKTMKVASITVSVPGLVFEYYTQNGLPEITANSITDIGKIHFDPKSVCGKNCYIPQEDDNKKTNDIKKQKNHDDNTVTVTTKTKLDTTTVNNDDGNGNNNNDGINKIDKKSSKNIVKNDNHHLDFDETELRHRTELYRHFKWSLQKITFTLNTSEIRLFEFNSTVDMIWPKLVKGIQILPPVEIGQQYDGVIIINNPSMKPIAINLSLSDPKKAKTTSLSLPLEVVEICVYCYLTDEDVFHLINDKYENSYNSENNGGSATTVINEDYENYINGDNNHHYTSNQVRLAHHNHKHDYVINANSFIAVKIRFVAKTAGLYSTLLHIKNNLTLYEAVWITGKAVQPQFRFGNRKPGSQTPLLFEINEKQLFICDVIKKSIERNNKGDDDDDDDDDDEDDDDDDNINGIDVDEVAAAAAAAATAAGFKDLNPNENLDLSALFLNNPWSQNNFLYSSSSSSSIASFLSNSNLNMIGIPIITTKRTFTARNTGEVPILIETFFINDRQCEGYGFKILNCNQFELKSNSSKKIDIIFTPDFTMSRITRTLIIKTNLSYAVNYTLLATVPNFYLEQCSTAIQRPFWEVHMKRMSIGMLAVAFIFVLIAAFLDSVKILTDHVQNMSRDKGPVQPPLDLRNIGLKVAAATALASVNLSTTLTDDNYNMNHDKATTTANITTTTTPAMVSTSSSSIKSQLYSFSSPSSTSLSSTINSSVKRKNSKRQTTNNNSAQNYNNNTSISSSSNNNNNNNGGRGKTSSWAELLAKKLNSKLTSASSSSSSTTNEAIQQHQINGKVKDEKQHQQNTLSKKLLSNRENNTVTDSPNTQNSNFWNYEFLNSSVSSVTTKKTNISDNNNVNNHNIGEYWGYDEFLNASSPPLENVSAASSAADQSSNKNSNEINNKKPKLSFKKMSKSIINSNNSNNNNNNSSVGLVNANSSNAISSVGTNQQQSTSSQKDQKEFGSSGKHSPLQDNQRKSTKFQQKDSNPRSQIITSTPQNDTKINSTSNDSAMFPTTTKKYNKTPGRERKKAEQNNTNSTTTAAAATTTATASTITSSSVNATSTNVTFTPTNTSKRNSNNNNNSNERKQGGKFNKTSAFQFNFQLQPHQQQNQFQPSHQQHQQHQAHAISSPSVNNCMWDKNHQISFSHVVAQNLPNSSNVINNNTNNVFDIDAKMNYIFNTNQGSCFIDRHHHQQRQQQQQQQHQFPYNLQQHHHHQQQQQLQQQQQQQQQQVRHHHQLHHTQQLQQYRSHPPPPPPHHHHFLHNNPSNSNDAGGVTVDHDWNEADLKNHETFGNGGINCTNNQIITNSSSTTGDIDTKRNSIDLGPIGPRKSPSSTPVWEPLSLPIISRPKCNNISPSASSATTGSVSSQSTTGNSSFFSSNFPMGNNVTGAGSNKAFEFTSTSTATASSAVSDATNQYFGCTSSLFDQLLLETRNLHRWETNNVLLSLLQQSAVAAAVVPSSGSSNTNVNQATAITSTANNSNTIGNILRQQNTSDWQIDSNRLWSPMGLYQDEPTSSSSSPSSVTAHPVNNCIGGNSNVGSGVISSSTPSSSPSSSSSSSMLSESKMNLWQRAHSVRPPPGLGLPKQEQNPINSNNHQQESRSSLLSGIEQQTIKSTTGTNEGSSTTVSDEHHQQQELERLLQQFDPFGTLNSIWSNTWHKNVTSSAATSSNGNHNSNNKNNNSNNDNTNHQQ